MSLFLLHTLEQFSYPGLFLLLLGGSIVVPIPEEVTLITGGYLIALGILNFYLSIPIAALGLLIGDVILFALARKGSSYARRLRERVNKIGLEKTWIFSPKEPLRAVGILRFLTGFRFIAPIYAGFEQASWKGYLLVDMVAICIFVPGMLLLGFLFHSTIITFLAGFEVVRHTLFIGILALAGVGLVPSLYLKLRERSQKSRQER